MQTIYHLAPAERWQRWPADAAYLPAEFEAEGFIHCTAGDELMLRIANRFYRDEAGDFVLLVIDPNRLSTPLKWELSDDPALPAFPHIYGPIDRAAIIEVRAARRGPDGEFLGW